MNERRAAPFPRGVFTLSVNLELLWGRIDAVPCTRFEPLCRVERQQVIGGILELLSRHRIPATWCTVGHLFLDCCTPHGHTRGLMRFTEQGLPCDPYSNERNHPTLYGRELVGRILDCRPTQEIGCHSFTHAVFTEPACTPDIAAAELAASVTAARDLGLALRSFAFPKSRAGHIGLLPQYGFTIFRGPELTLGRTRSRWAARISRVLGAVLTVRPELVHPRWHAAGIWELPVSMVYPRSSGWSGMLPPGLCVTRARRGLQAAAEQRGIFHLSLDPADFATEPAKTLPALNNILAIAARLREEAVLEILTMDQIARRISGPGLFQYERMPA